jgi:hypothetical protein
MSLTRWSSEYFGLALSEAVPAVAVFSPSNSSALRKLDRTASKSSDGSSSSDVMQSAMSFCASPK